MTVPNLDAFTLNELMTFHVYHLDRRHDGELFFPAHAYVHRATTVRRLSEYARLRWLAWARHNQGDVTAAQRYAVLAEGSYEILPDYAKFRAFPHP